MSRKTEACYKHIFETTKKEIFDLNGESMMSDYEKAMRNAFHAVYPDVVQHSCWFHFCQAAKKKASQMPQLMNVIKTNELVKNGYYKLLALPLLPSSDIVPCFHAIKSTVSDVEAMKQYLNYFNKQWIVQVMLTSLLCMARHSDHINDLYSTPQCSQHKIF